MLELSHSGKNQTQYGRAMGKDWPRFLITDNIKQEERNITFYNGWTDTRHTDEQRADLNSHHTNFYDRNTSNEQQ